LEQDIKRRERRRSKYLNTGKDLFFKVCKGWLYVNGLLKVVV